MTQSQMQYAMPSWSSAQRSPSSGPLRLHRNFQQRQGKTNDRHLPKCQTPPPLQGGEQRLNDSKAVKRGHRDDRLLRTSDTLKSRRSWTHTLMKYKTYINVGEILTASNKSITDMPALQGYTTPTGSSCICWNSVLGRCFKGKRCRYSAKGTSINQT